MNKWASKEKVWNIKAGYVASYNPYSGSLAFPAPQQQQGPVQNYNAHIAQQHDEELTITHKKIVKCFYIVEKKLYTHKFNFYHKKVRIKK